MKVAIDSRNLTKEIGSGVGWYTKQLIESLAKYTSHEVFAWYNAFRQNAVNSILPRFASDKVHFKVTDYPNRLLRGVWGSSLKSLLPLDRLLPGFDIYHAPSPYLPLPPAQRVKRIVTVHDLTFLTHPEFHIKPHTAIKKHFQQTVNQADALITVSRSTRNDLVIARNESEGKTHVVYSAAREIFRKLSAGELDTHLLERHGVKRPFLLYVGNLEPRKNVTGLIEAFEQLVNEAGGSKNLQLVLIGGLAWKSEKIKRSMEASRVKDRIKHLGYLPDSQIVQFYNQAELFVYPSFYEGFGLPIVEAMACGCPVLTSNISSLPEVGGEAAWYVDPNSVEEIFVGMRDFLQLSSQAKQQLRQESLAQAQKFSWQKTVQATSAVYREVLYNQ